VPRDTFDGSGALSPNWAKPTNVVGTMRRASGQAVGNTGSDHSAAYWVAQPFTPAQYARGIIGTIETNAGGGYGTRLCVHMDPVADSYYGLRVHGAAAIEVQLIERVAGTDNILDSDTLGDTPATGQQAELTIDDDGLLVGRVNLIERVSQTDIPIIGGPAGMAAWRADVNNGWLEWEGGDIESTERKVLPLPNTMKPPLNVRFG
jgi:hypothetical protein